jgi:hypothetical protein
MMISSVYVIANSLAGIIFPGYPAGSVNFDRRQAVSHLSRHLQLPCYRRVYVFADRLTGKKNQAFNLCIAIYQSELSLARSQFHHQSLRGLLIIESLCPYRQRAGKQKMAVATNYDISAIGLDTDEHHYGFKIGFTPAEEFNIAVYQSRGPDSYGLY